MDSNWIQENPLCILYHDVGLKKGFDSCPDLMLHWDVVSQTANRVHLFGLSPFVIVFDKIDWHVFLPKLLIF